MTVYEQLLKKPKDVLKQIATGEGIKVAIRWGKPELARKILEARKLKELNTEITEPENKNVIAERNPELEKMLGGTKSDEELLGGEVPAEPDNRGGFRENAGRTPGLTDEKARINKIIKNQVPNPTIVFLADTFFDVWQSRVPVKGIALSDEEATMLAVPLTNLQEYYFPNLQLSPVMEMWAGLVIASREIVKDRIMLIKLARENGELVSPDDEVIEQPEEKAE